MQWLYWICAACCCDPVRPPFCPGRSFLQGQRCLLPFLLCLTQMRTVCTGEKGAAAHRDKCNASMQIHTITREQRTHGLQSREYLDLPSRPPVGARTAPVRTDKTGGGPGGRTRRRWSKRSRKDGLPAD